MKVDVKWTHARNISYNIPYNTQFLQTVPMAVY